MAAETHGRCWWPLAVAVATTWSGPVLAATICTHVPTGAEYPVPLAERQSLRQMQSSVIPELVAKGDTLAGQGELAEAAKVYKSAFGGFRDRHGMLHGSERCLSNDVYQQVANKLRVVATRLAEQRMNEGHVIDESHSYGGTFQRGGLGLYLASNQYEAYIEHAFEYARSELQARDIDDELVVMVTNRLGEIDRMRDVGQVYEAIGLVNDMTPMLPEELLAFDELAGFEERLRAHLAPAYPSITDHWLAEEARNFYDAINTDGMIPKGLMFGRATDALERGIKRLHEHPEELARLRTRANVRGTSLLAQDQYQPARDYFEIAENEASAAKAGRLAETQQSETAEQLEVSLRSAVEKMKKTDEEQAAFQDEADEMAKEFGFDLEE